MSEPLYLNPPKGGWRSGEGPPAVSVGAPKEKPAPIGHRFEALARGSVRTRGRMNNTEKKYAAQLQLLKDAGEILHFDFERVKLRLTTPPEGEKAVWFTADFIVIDAQRRTIFDDVKGTGPDNEASIMRIKTAAEICYWWTFRIAKLTASGEFSIREL